MKHVKMDLLVISTLLIIATLVACNAKPGERTRYVDETYPIENYVKSFLDNHKDFNTNDITRENTNIEFKKQILDTLEKDNLLRGLPVKLETIGKVKGSYIAQFRSWIHPSGFKFKSPIDDLYFDIVGSIPDSLATKISDNEYYIINGSFISKLNSVEEIEVLLGKSTTAYTNSISIQVEKITKDFEVNLGILFFDITSIEPFNGRKTIEEKY